MPSPCCVPYCRSRGGFTFPKNARLHLEWRLAVNRRHRHDARKLWEPSKYSVVCKEHFRPEDFKPPEIKYSDRDRLLLHEGAVPSIFPASGEGDGDGAPRLSKYYRTKEATPEVSDPDKETDPVWTGTERLVERTSPDPDDPLPMPAMATSSSTGGRQCSVAGCHNNDVHDQGRVRFFPFPKHNPHQRQLWLAAVGGVNSDGLPWEPKEWSRVCSDHFISGHWSPSDKDKDYVPSRFPNASPLKKGSTRQTLAPRSRPVVKIKTEPLDHLDKTDVQMARKRPRYVGRRQVGVQTAGVLNSKSSEFQFECHFDQRGNVSTQINGTASLNVSAKTATTDFRQPVQSQTTAAGSAAVGTSSWSSRLQSEGALLAALGVKPSLLLVLSDMVAGSVSSGSLSADDKVCLFLSKLRLDLPLPSLAAMFNADQRAASAAFSQVLDVLYYKISSHPWWLPRDVVQATMPQSFKQTFPDCRAVIDAVELPCQKPGGGGASSTLRFFLAVAPSGLVTFVSKTYGALIRDSHLTSDCGFLDCLQTGDVLLAGRPLPCVAEAAAKVGASVQWGPAECGRLARDSIDRAMTKLKQFRALQVVGESTGNRVDKMLRVIAFICNHSAEATSECT